jgi:hypothetical protein
MATDKPHEEGRDQSLSGRELSFYEIDASTIDDAARKLIINYAGVAPEDVEAHIDAVVRVVLTLQSLSADLILESESVQYIPLSMYRHVPIP